MPLLRRRRAAPPVPIDAAALRAALSPLLELVGPPQGRPLSAAQRRLLGSRLLSDAPRLARAVARGLKGRPELFPDMPLHGDALAALQTQADGWRELRDALRFLQEQANDRFLVTQSASAEQALAVLRQVDGAAALPFACGLPDAREREAALGEARALLQRRREAQRRHGLKARRPAVDASRAGRRAMQRPAPRTKR